MHRIGKPSDALDLPARTTSRTTARVRHADAFSASGANVPRQTTSSGPRLYTLHDVGVVKNALRLEQVQHLVPTACGRRRLWRLAETSPRQNASLCSKILGALSFSLGNRVVGDRGQCPRRLNQLRSLGKEGRGKPIQWIGFLGPPPQKLAQQTCFLGRHAHPLTMDGVEAAYRIAERKQPAREFLRAGRNAGTRWPENRSERSRPVARRP